MSSVFPLRERVAPQLHPHVSAVAHLRTRGLRVAALIPHTCVQPWWTLYLLCSQSFQLLLGSGYHQIKQTDQPEEPALAPLHAETSIPLTQTINVWMYLGGKPTLTRPLIGQKLVAFFAAALEASHRISTHVIAAAVVEAALVDIFKQKAKHTKKR